MTTALSIPRELLPEFRAFGRDFDRACAAFVARGEETDESIVAAREGLRAYLANPADPDEYGTPRADRLRAVFGYWRALALRVAGRGICVAPVLSAESESRAADRAWKRRMG